MSDRIDIRMLEKSIMVTIQLKSYIFTIEKAEICWLWCLHNQQQRNFAMIITNAKHHTYTCMLNLSLGQTIESSHDLIHNDQPNSYI